MARTAYHHGDLPSLILKQARAMIGKRGLGAFSMRDLSRKLGVSHAAAYRHFSSKEALLGALILDANTRFFHCLSEARDVASGDPAERLYAIGEAYLRFGLEDPADLELLFSGEAMAITKSAWESGKVDEETLRSVDSFQILRGTVNDCIAGGYLPSGSDVDAMSVLFWSLVQGYCVLAREGALVAKGAERGMREPDIRKALLSSLRSLVRK